MKYLGSESDVSNSNSKTGILLMNLGTPERPVCPGLRDYLSEFLMDPRVIEIPKFFRALLVKGIIINVRSHKSAATYREIWTENGSPLLINSLKLGEKTAALLGDNFEVEVAMRYGKPSIEDKVAALHEKGVRSIIAIPLYPQYSGSTNGSTFDAIGAAFTKQRWVPNLNFVSDYYRNDLYIKAIGDSIKEYWQDNGRNQKLVMSFHGIPQKYITRGDPYQSQCSEIEGENKEYFIEAGGEEYNYIPCLNDADSHANLMVDIIKKRL